MKTIGNWFKETTVRQQEALAKLASTTRGALLQIRYGHREASANMAARLERAALRMIGKGYAVSPLPREEVCTACAECPYAKAHNAAENLGMGQ